MTQYVPFLPNRCSGCSAKQNPQFVFNSTLLTIAVIAISFVVSFAINQALTQTFEEMFDRSDELVGRWNYAYIATASAIVIVFLLMYNLNGTKW